MRSQPTLVRVLTPCPVGPNNLLHGTSSKAIHTNALAVHLAKAAPFSPLRVSPFKNQLTTLHPSRPMIAYVVIPEGTEKDKFSTTIVVQNTQTKESVYTQSLGDLASIIFNYDVVSRDEKIVMDQQRALKELGPVQRLDFFDPSTLYWSGHGAEASQGGEDRWSYLLVHLQTRVIIVNLRQKTVSVANGTATDTSRVFSPVLASISRTSLGDQMTSNVVPISPSHALVGTANGHLKIVDWMKNSVIKSASIFSAKDAVVEILPANKYLTPAEYETKTRSRLVCLTKRGSAFLIEVHFHEGDTYDIVPPAASFEGGSVPSSMSMQDEEHTSMEHIFVQYCAYRDLLLWNFPSKSAKGKLFVWALGDIINDGGAKNRSTEPMKYEPTLVVQFPYEATHTIFPGWFHESIPVESVACAAVTKDGDFQILVAPLYNSGSTTKNPFQAYPIFRTDLHLLLLRDLDLPEECEINTKVQTISSPPLRDSSIFYFGTSLGILMVKMVDGNLVHGQGSRHVHLSANFGGLGKAALMVKGPEVLYGNLESPGGPLALDPIGKMELKNHISLYESPAPLHLPPEIHKRPARLPPLFLMSPSKNFLCVFWKEEMRYEILHMTSLLDMITSRRIPAIKSPMVASGNGVASFAWVGDSDVFSLLYNPEQDIALKAGVDLSASSVKKLAGGKKLGKISKLQSLKGLQDIGKGTAKGITGIGKGMTKGTLKMTGKVGKVTLATTMKTKLAVGTVGGGATKVAKMGFKAAKFGFGKKKKAKDQNSSLATADDDDGETITSSQTPIGTIGQEMMSSAQDSAITDLERKFPWVELRSLADHSTSNGTSSTITPAGIGELLLRSGNRNPPTVLFGGPVLCVASKTDENDEGLAYFYTKKRDSKDEDAAEYVSSGPAFPCPDLVVWDDEGRLCAVVVQATVSIYQSEEPNFTMLGTVKVGTSFDNDIQVIGAMFLHGVLFVTTRTAVQIVFLGNLQGDGDVCHLDVYTLASSDIFTLPSKSGITELTPRTIPMPLNYPVVLGYQSGSLILSTVSGIHAIPLSSPLLRIGALLGAGHQQKAKKWFDAVPLSQHESLAIFLERRGVPEFALGLKGISLEHSIDLCMRYNLTSALEELVDRYGLAGIQSVDMGRGLSTNIFRQQGTSLVVCVGAYLLSQGRLELVRRLATECIRANRAGNQDAFMLASLLMTVETADSRRLMQRALHDEDSSPGRDWVVGKFVREHVLHSP